MAVTEKKAWNRRASTEASEWEGARHRSLHKWCWIQDPDAHACKTCSNIFMKFLYWILVDNNSWLFIYLPVTLLFVRVGGRGAAKQGSAWVITQKKLCWEHSSLLRSVARVISISVAVVSVLWVSYYHEWQDSLWCIQTGL